MARGSRFGDRFSLKQYLAANHIGVVKLTFSKGASLKDPSGLFNSSLEGNTRLAIDLHEGEAIDEDAFKALIRAAVSLNKSSRRAPKEKPGT